MSMQRGLPRPDTVVARAPDKEPLSLPCTDPEGPEQYMSDRVERRRISLLDDRRKEWVRRAKEATSEGSADYCAARARSLRTPLTPRVRRCGTVLMEVACGAGRRATVPRGCRQWWICARCRGRRARAQGLRIREGLEAAVEAGQRGGRRIGLRLLTLTVRHSGSVDTDRKALKRGWRALYKSLREWLGRVPYAATWEVTPGRDGLGHVHIHVAVVWPRWVDYGRVRALWLRACPESARIHIVGGGKRAGKTPESAAYYLAKYISKGVEGVDFADDLKASVLASFYNCHLILTSRKFFGPKVCKCCGTAWRLVFGSWLRDAHAIHRGTTETAADAHEDRGRGYTPRLL
jgi:hypothetical protein